MTSAPGASEFILVPLEAFTRMQREERNATPTTTTKRSYPGTFAEQRVNEAFETNKRRRFEEPVLPGNAISSGGNAPAAVDIDRERLVTERLLQLIDDVASSKRAMTRAVNHTQSDAVEFAEGQSSPPAAAPAEPSSSKHTDTSTIDANGVNAQLTSSSRPSNTPDVLHESTAVAEGRSTTDANADVDQTTVLERILRSGVATKRGRSLFNIILQHAGSDAYNNLDDTYHFGNVRVDSTKHLAFLIKAFVSRTLSRNTTLPKNMSNFISYTLAIPSTHSLAGEFVREKYGLGKGAAITTELAEEGTSNVNAPAPVTPSAMEEEEGAVGSNTVVVVLERPPTFGMILRPRK